MNRLRTATSTGLLAVAAALPATGLAADIHSTSAGRIEIAQAPNNDPDGDPRKDRRGDRGGEGRGDRGGEGRERGDRGGEGRGDRGSEGRGDRGGERRGGDRGGESRERGDRGREGRGGEGSGGERNAPPVQAAPPPQVAPPAARREVPPQQAAPPAQVAPPAARREAAPPPQDQQRPPARADRPEDRLRDIRDRMRQRAQPTDRGDRGDRGDRDERVRDRGDRFRDDRYRDDRRRPVEVEDRRAPAPPPQVQPERRLESFKDRFRSRVGEDRAFQDLRRGRDERVRERNDRIRAATPFRRIDDLKSRRQERREGNAVVIDEPDKRSIVREGGRSFIRTDENERLRRNFRDVRREKRDGRDVTIAIGAGGMQIYTEFDDDGRTRRRWRRGPDGREFVLFDNSRSDGWRRRHGRGAAGFFDAIVDLPPPRLRIPRDRYIVDYDRASEDDLYDALSAPPVEEIDDRYSLDEIRFSPRLRDRMRRIDLDTINFAFGSWDVEERDYDRLERIARAMRRVLRRNTDEMFLVEGHTDAVGSDDDNLTLSDRRAESVARILSEEFGVPMENLTTQGYGEQFLKIDTDAPEEENRRVAIRRITPLLAR